MMRFRVNRYSSFFLIFVLLLASINPSVTATFAEEGSGNNLLNDEANVSGNNTLEESTEEALKEKNEEEIDELSPQETVPEEVSFIMTSPNNNFITNDSELIFIGEYSGLDPESELLLVVSDLSTEEIVLEKKLETDDTGIGIWSKKLDLEEGAYSTYLKLTAGETEITTEPADFYVMLSGPEVIVDYAVEEDYYTNSLLISGTWDSIIGLVPIDGIELTPTVELFFKQEEMALEDIEEMSPIVIPVDEDGTWSIQLEEVAEERELELEDGTYYFFVKSEDAAGNEVIVGLETEEGELQPFVYNYHTVRPYISPNLNPFHKETQVELGDLVIEFNYMSQIPLNVEEFKKIVTITDGSQRIKGKLEYDDKIDEKGYITFTFIPENEKLNPNTRYDVIINPRIKDVAGNPIHPRIWSFTTAVADGVKTIHQQVMNNTNTCATCHSPHMADEAKLIKGKIEAEIDDSGETKTFDTVQAYCMACHDGTSASAIEGADTKHKHEGRLTTHSGSEVTTTCTSCHDPHSMSSEGNPYHLQSHFTFDHEGIVDNDGEPIGFQDSKVTLCETCHISSSESDDDVTTSWQAYNSDKTTYTLFAYANRNSFSIDDDGEPVPFGSADSYSLCLRCHNAEYRELYPNVVDIKQYYLMEPEEITKDDGSKEMFYGHFITEDRVRDGSLINGYLACDDCHSRHGSDNEKLIHTKIGHNNPKKFSWDSDRDEGERAFCLTCHNTTEQLEDAKFKPTEVYGITPVYNMDRPEHDNNEGISCATCHGGEERDFIRAVHAPTKGK